MGGLPGGWAGVGLSLSVGVEQERKEKGKDKKKEDDNKTKNFKKLYRDRFFFLFRGKCTILKVGVLGVFRTRAGRGECNRQVLAFIDMQGKFLGLFFMCNSATYSQHIIHF